MALFTTILEKIGVRLDKHEAERDRCDQGRNWVARRRHGKSDQTWAKKQARSTGFGLN